MIRTYYVYGEAKSQPKMKNGAGKRVKLRTEVGGTDRPGSWTGDAGTGAMGKLEVDS